MLAAPSSHVQLVPRDRKTEIYKSPEICKILLRSLLFAQEEVSTNRAGYSDRTPAASEYGLKGLDTFSRAMEDASFAYRYLSIRLYLENLLASRNICSI
jgi:hypothetical protein